MEFSFTIKTKDRKVRARRGIIFTPHGQIETPAFSPVATRATVRALDIKDLKATGTQVVLANTYHLYLSPGLETIEKFGGFAPFMDWCGPTITDSGGYQVSFLWKGIKQSKENGEDYGKVLKITDEGALFASHLDGSRHLLTPEKSMEIQRILGADIMMALDQPIGLAYSEKQKKEAFRRTMLWEERSFMAWKKQPSKQALFGIIQGDEGEDLRRQSLKFLLGFDFSGLAVGGQSIGVDPQITAKTLDGIADLLTEDKPLHALGLGGGPEGIFEAVERGVDLFDNTSVTRMARNGHLLVYPEDGGKPGNKFRFDILKKRFQDDKKPISRICQCYTCQYFSRAYLCHLLRSGELLGYRLASIHNVFFINDLMGRIRQAIKGNDFLVLKKEWLGV